MRDTKSKKKFTLDLFCQFYKHKFKIKQYKLYNIKTKVYCRFLLCDKVFSC